MSKTDEELTKENLLYEVEKEEFHSTYKKRYGYVPSRKEYSPIPLRLQYPSIQDVYHTEHIYVPEHWDHAKRIRFMVYVYNMFTIQSRL